MEPVTQKWSFDIPPDGAVVTTKYVTQDGEPILYVVHECDEEDDVVWQFHCGNNDYGSSVIQLVRLDEILSIDPSLYELASLALGFCARRASRESRWVIGKAS